MNLCASVDSDVIPQILVEEPDPEHCDAISLPPEGNIKLQNYRLVNDNVRTYTPTGDIHTTPAKGKLMPKFDVCAQISPPRSKILELLRPEDPGRDALEAIVRPASRRGLIKPYDEDTKRFLQRVLLTPSPGASQSVTPEPRSETDEKQEVNQIHESKKERSLADELREAEEDERSGGNIRRELLREFRKRGGGIRESMERDRLGKLALAVEDDEEYEDKGLSGAARRLDALLAESRSLHEELAGIHEDIQVLARRVSRQDL